MILATASRRLDWNKAADYLKRIESGALVRRFGWLADHVKSEIPPGVREQLLTLSGRSTRAWLGPSPGSKKLRDAIGYDETWRLFVNVPREELHGSVGLGLRKSARKDR